jgi:hypothetical protein
MNLQQRYKKKFGKQNSFEKKIFFSRRVMRRKSPEGATALLPGRNYQHQK